LKTKVSIKLTQDISKFLYENGIDFAEQLRRYIPNLEFSYEQNDSGSKDLALIIIASGIAATSVVFAINQLISTIIKKPKYVEVLELTEDGNVLVSHIEMLQPVSEKRETNIEISAGNIRFKVLDKSE